MSASALERALQMNGSWADFEKMLDPAVKAQIENKRELANEDRKAIAKAWADFAATPGGAKALDLMFEKTLHRVVFMTQLGMNAEQVAIHGAFREGQMALADEIRRLIIEGNGDTPPPRRGIID